jgi:hypothetical protein
MYNFTIAEACNVRFALENHTEGKYTSYALLA